MSALSERPERATVGLTIPHESAALHVTGRRALHRRPRLAHQGRAARLPGAGPACARPGHRAAHRTGVAVPGVVRVLTAADIPGVNDAGVKHDEPLFPDEIMFYGHAVCWVLGETLEAARLGAAAVEVDVEPLPSFVTVTEAIAAGAFQGAQPHMERGDVEAALADSAHVFSGEFEFSGQEHFYLETHAALALVDEAGQIFVQSSTQHPSETQEIVAHVLGRHNHEVTVQCLRMGGGFGGKEMQPHGFAAIAALGATLTGRPVRLRLNRTQDLTMSGKRHGFHADWRVGFDEDGRLQRPGRDPDRRRRMEPRPIRAGARPSAVPHRQRLLDPERPGERADRQDEQDVEDRVPRLRRPAGHARDRGHPRSLRAAARRRPGRAATPQLLPAGQTTPVRPAGSAP